MNSKLLKALTKPALALALAGALSTAMVAPASAGHRGNGKLFLGLGLGLLAGSIILNHNRYSHYPRYNSNLYVSDPYDDNYQQSCYRSHQVVCTKKYSCEYDDYGNRFCQPHRSCYHPVVCN